LMSTQVSTTIGIGFLKTALQEPLSGHACHAG
jgi:hypothetical protein